MNAQRSKGFTLVEIAIVLVIIGLLLGGVLKGQEMINNAKIKRITSDFEGISAAVFSYQDRYRSLPGDDNTATTRWTGATNGNSDGIIAGNFNTTTGTAESRAFWQHLRFSNLIPGPTAGPAAYNQPRNSYSGLIGIENTRYTLTGLVICMNGIDGPSAAIVDTQTDDGLPGSGTIQAGLGNSGAVAPNYNSTTSTYTLCRKL